MQRKRITYLGQGSVVDEDNSIKSIQHLIVVVLECPHVMGPRTRNVVEQYLWVVGNLVASYAHRNLIRAHASSAVVVSAFIAKGIDERRFANIDVASEDDILLVFAITHRLLSADYKLFCNCWLICIIATSMMIN